MIMAAKLLPAANSPHMWQSRHRLGQEVRARLLLRGNFQFPRIYNRTMMYIAPNTRQNLLFGAICVRGPEINEPLNVSKIISANRLADGIVVYAGYGGAWVERLNEAVVFSGSEEAEAGLTLAQGDVARNLIVEPFVVDVTQDATGLRPSTLRDSIRAHGPTIEFLPRRKALSPSAIPPRKNPGTPPARQTLRAASLAEAQIHEENPLTPAIALVDGIVAQ
jgi:hypothetical protein